MDKTEKVAKEIKELDEWIKTNPDSRELKRALAVKLTEEQKQEVITWLQEQEYWDLAELECHLIDQYDVVFKSPTSYYALLKEAKISWQKAQPKNPRQDPEKLFNLFVKFKLFTFPNLQTYDAFSCLI